MIGSKSHRQIELFEGRYAHVREREINLDKYQEAVEMFVGHHCFGHFVTKSTKNPDPKGYMRTIKDIKVEVAAEKTLMLDEHRVVYTHIIGTSFLWHQIRIMLRAALMHADNELSLKQIDKLLKEGNNEEARFFTDEDWATQDAKPVTTMDRRQFSKKLLPG